MTRHRRRIASGLALAVILIAALFVVSEGLDATGCGGSENCMGDDSGRCMTHDLWASLNTKMIEYLDSISLKKLVDAGLLDREQRRVLLRLGQQVFRDAR